MAHVEEDEWEYEYDDHETEDFYIPVDLANVPAIQGPLGYGAGSTQKGHPTLLATKLRAINAERLEAGSNLAVQHVEGTADSMGKIQIIGLHTENPLIMYNDQLLSCEWNKTIGTDLIFAKPNPNTGEAGEPLRSLPSVDLLATGSAKLVARVARIRPRDDLFDDEPRVDEQGPTMPAEAVVTSEGNEPIAATENACEVAPAIAPDLQPTRPAPSSFLGRLNAVKAKRGEGSRLILAATPDGSRLVAAEEEESADFESPAGEDVVMSGT